MTAKVSPYLDTLYGWQLGEDGWNTGMDKNILNYSFLHNRNFDGIVSSIPATPTGNVAYFNQQDQLIYYAIEGSWRTLRLPKWFELVDKSTGSLYRFNGTTLDVVSSGGGDDTKAPLDSPAFIGTPIAPTAPAGTDTTQIATTAFVKTAVDAALGQQTVATVIPISANTTAEANQRYLSTAKLTLTLPASPAPNTSVGVALAGSDAITTIARNGSNIMSLSENLIVNVPNKDFTLTYINTTQGWVLT